MRASGVHTGTQIWAITMIMKNMLTESELDDDNDENDENLILSIEILYRDQPPE